MFPRWISWVFLLFIGYLIYTGNRASHMLPSPAAAPSPSATTLAASTNLANYPALQRFTDGNRWHRALNPQFIGSTTIVDTSAGHGAPAQCADAVTIHLRGTLGDGANFDPDHDESKPLTFRLGDAPYAVLNEALIGMREGGVRQITAPPQWVFAEGTHKTMDDVLLRVTLDHLDAPPDPGPTLGAHIYIDRNGSGAPAACGAPTKLRLSLWNRDGSVQYKTAQPVTVRLGKDSLPREFALGVGAMQPGEMRTLLLPPEAADNEKLSAALPAPIRDALGSDEVTILTVTRVE